MFEDSRIVFEVSNERGRRRRPNRKVMLKAINVPVEERSEPRGVASRGA